MSPPPPPAGAAGRPDQTGYTPRHAPGLGPGQDPARPVSDLDLLTAGERRNLLHDWNDTARVIPAATLPELFQAQVARTPDALAVIAGDEHLSYAGLNARATRPHHTCRQPQTVQAK